MELCGLSSFWSDSLNSAKNSSSPFSKTIRKAQLQDIKGLTEVITQSFHPTKGCFSLVQPLLRLGVYEDLRSRLRADAPHYCCLVALEISETATGQQEKVIGTIELTLRSSFNTHYPYISNLAVAHSHRRQGIARNLLIKCEQIAKEWGHQTLSLHVLDNNYAAKKLYTNSGYQLSETELNWPNWLFHNRQRLLLQKTLEPFSK
ncbi:MAG: GNAT family N-acetyltransferase [Cyanobacteria bacterium P01_G01_bin.49]